MKQQEIQETVTRVAQSTFGVTRSKINMQTNLRSDLMADSMLLIELAVSLEEEFDREMEGLTEVAEIQTIGDVVRLIDGVINPKDASV